jgi:hypothetical protein
MANKKTIAGCIFALLIAFGSCNNDDEGDPADETPTTQSFGTFQVSLMADDGYTSVLGKMYDGPSIPTMFFEEIAASGCRKLFKRRYPLCVPECGGLAVCVEDDSCQPHPSAVNIGTVTISGLDLNDGQTTFSMDPINSNYMYTSIKFPPCNEGEAVTLTASGSSSVPAFTLTVKGIAPLTLLNDTIKLIDGQPIDLQWTKPTVTGISSIFVLINISYHAGTNAKIECECDDNGSLTVPAKLLDSLKYFGISGFPKLEISRRAVSTDTTARAKLVVESKVVKMLQIPGVISCNDSADCPEGQYCAPDQRCRPK